MKTRDKVLALGGGAAFLLGVGLLWPRADPYPDGAGALARVATLRKGLIPYDALRYLHPTYRVSGFKVSVESGFLQSRAARRLEQIHGLTTDRYIILHYTQIKEDSDPLLESWELKEGLPPREDVDRTRHLVLGGHIFRF